MDTYRLGLCERKHPDTNELENYSNKESDHEEQHRDDGEDSQQNTQSGFQADLTEKVQDPNSENRF